MWNWKRKQVQKHFSIKKIKKTRTKFDKLKELKEDAIENKTKIEKWIEIKRIEIKKRGTKSKEK